MHRRLVSKEEHLAAVRRARRTLRGIEALVWALVVSAFFFAMEAGQVLDRVLDSSPPSVSVLRSRVPLAHGAVPRIGLIFPPCGQTDPLRCSLGRDRSRLR